MCCFKKSCYARDMGTRHRCSRLKLIGIFHCGQDKESGSCDIGLSKGSDGEHTSSSKRTKHVSF